MIKVKWFLIGAKAIEAFMNRVEVVNFGIREGKYKVTYITK